MEGPCLQGEGKGRESGKGNLAVLSFTLQLRLQFSSSPPGKASRGGEKGKKGDGFGEGKREELWFLWRVERGMRNEEGR